MACYHLLTSSQQITGTVSLSPQSPVYLMRKLTFHPFQTAGWAQGFLGIFWKCMGLLLLIERSVCMCMCVCVCVCSCVSACPPIFSPQQAIPLVSVGLLLLWSIHSAEVKQLASILWGFDLKQGVWDEVWLYIQWYSEEEKNRCGKKQKLGILLEWK